MMRWRHIAFPLMGALMACPVAGRAATEQAKAALSIENARPAAIPPRPRLTTPGAVATPPMLIIPEAMPIPEVPSLSPQSPIAAPVAPVNAPPVKRPAPPEPPQAAVAPEAMAPPPPPIILPHVAFAPGSSDLPEAAETRLREAAAKLNAAPELRLQLRAYAAGSPEQERDLRRLSLARALAVRERLTALGIRGTRVDVRPLGAPAPGSSDVPDDRVDLEYVTN